MNKVTLFGISGQVPPRRKPGPRLDSVLNLDPGFRRGGALFLLMSMFALSGCVAVWGAPYKVEFKSSSSITFSYDPVMANWGEIQNIAQGHCDQYGKDAVVHKKSNSAWGLITVDYLCKKRGK